MSNSEHEKQPIQDNSASRSRESNTKQRPKPGFMSMRWLRQHLKGIIWAVVITFLVSLFFIGYGTRVENQRRAEKAAEFESAEAQRDSARNALPEKLQGKGNIPAVFVSYNTSNASITAAIDAKTLWRAIVNTDEYARLQQMPEAFRQYYVTYLKENALDNLIKLNLLNLYAKANNIVPPISINDIISRDKQQISEREFNRNLSKRGMTIEEYGQERMQQVTIGAVSQTALVQISPASATEDFLKNYYENHKSSFKKNDSISFAHLLVSPSAFSFNVEVADEDIKKYYEENKATFVSSPRVEVSHIYINTTEPSYIDKMEVVESELIKTYNENKNRFTVEEQVKASHILIKPRGESEDSEERFKEAKKVIDSIYERAKKGEDFAELAKANSEDEGSAKDGGDLGYFERGTMVKPFEEAAFTSEVGHITEPIRTQFGYHVIKIEGKTPEKQQSFEEVKPILASEAKTKQAEIMAATTLEDIRRQSLTMGSAEAFVKAVKQNSHGRSAKNNGKLVFFKGEVTDDYSKEDKEMLQEEVCDRRNFIPSEIEEKVFALKKGEISEVIKTINGYHLFRLENNLDPVPLKLTDSLEATIRGILTEKAADEEAKKTAEKLVKENPTADIDKMVSAYGKEEENRKHTFSNLPFSDNPGMTYQELAEGAGIFSDNGRLYLPEFHKQVSSMVKSNMLNSYATPFKTTLGWHIVKVTDYKSNQYDSFAESRDTIRRIVTFEASDAEVNKYYEETKSQYDVPATRTIRQILCSDKDTADKVYAELEEGAVFAKMARDYSSDSSSVNGGAMSPAVKGTYTAALDEAIWALKKDEYTKPINTGYGWVIAKLEAETEEIKSSLDNSVISRIKRTLRENYRDEAWNYFIKGLVNRSYVVRNQEVIDLIQ